MNYYKLKKTETNNFLKELKQNYAVYAPVNTDGVISFQEITPDKKEVEIDLNRTHKPPKNIFYPQTEVLFTFDKDKIESKEYSGKPIAVFGIRPCDTKAITMLDNVFIDSDYKDTYWEARRKNSLIFTLGCNEPLPSCFCNWFEDSPFNERGADVLMTDIGNYYLFKPITNKGEENIKDSHLLEDATEEDKKEAQKRIKDSKEVMTPPSDLRELKSKLDNLKEDDEIWERLANKCVGCGVCTFSCPTCFCFDIHDDSRCSKGRRIRCWDTCQANLFTQEASGNNPRPSQKEKIRQRFMHKLSYMIDNQNEFGCVGCGRCISYCPVNIDIRNFIKEVLEKKGK